MKATMKNFLRSGRFYGENVLEDTYNIQKFAVFVTKKIQQSVRKHSTFNGKPKMFSQNFEVFFRFDGTVLFLILQPSL